MCKDHIKQDMSLLHGKLETDSTYRCSTYSVEGELIHWPHLVFHLCYQRGSLEFIVTATCMSEYSGIPAQ